MINNKKKGGKNDNAALPPLISVIVPVYKVEQFLSRCINSIRGQTYKHWELILIDDGSPDNSGKICDTYADRDQRILVIHQNNQGVSVARNAGLERVKGEYLYFVDSDDYLESTAFETLVGVAEKQHLDMVMHGHYRVESDGGLRDATDWDFSECTADIKRALLLDKIPNFVWGKLFRVDLWDGVRFPVGQVMEDMYVMAMLIVRAKHMKLITNPLYYYSHENGESIMIGVNLKAYVRVRYGKFLAWKEHARAAALYSNQCEAECVLQALHSAVRAYFLNGDCGYLSDEELSSIEIYLEQHKNYKAPKGIRFGMKCIIQRWPISLLGKCQQRIVLWQQRRRQKKRRQQR